MLRSRSLPQPIRGGRQPLSRRAGVPAGGGGSVPDRVCGPGGQEPLILRLAATLATDQAGDMAGQVLSRVHQAGSPVGMVIVVLEGDAGIDAGCRRALRSLQNSLRMIGARLRVVAAAPQAWQQLQDTGKDHPMNALAVHPSLRSAVLATYAELPGPGLVTGPVRVALDLPAEPLHVPAGELHPPRMGHVAGDSWWTEPA